MTRLMAKLGIAAAAAIGLTSAFQANAALFSSTKVEVLYGDYDERGGGEKQAILTIANASGFKYGDSYFFTDIVDVDDRDDPLFEDKSVQLNLVWNAPFTLGSAKFSFEGFLDWTTDEGDKDDPTFSKSNVLVLPQLVWHVIPNVGVGGEYQYWKNRLGIDSLDEKTPQLMFRWTF